MNKGLTEAPRRRAAPFRLPAGGRGFA